MRPRKRAVDHDRPRRPIFARRYRPCGVHRCVEDRARPIDRRMAETIEDLERCNKVLYSVILQKEPPMKPAGQMTLTLTEELEQFVRDEVRRGAFASSSEYVRTLVRERSEEHTSELQSRSDL